MLKLKNELVVNGYYNGIVFIEEMKAGIGKWLEVTETTKQGTDKFFTVLIDEETYIVSEDMVADYGIGIEKIGLSTKHYNFEYKLKPKDIEKSYIRLDPYFITKAWKLNNKDDTGVLFHCLKTIARFGEKNPIEREIRALNAQIKRLADLNGVEL